MKNLILVLLATLALGCVSPMVKTLPELEKPKIEINLSIEISQFIQWANTEFPKIQKQLGLKGAPRVVFYTSLGTSLEKDGNFYSILGQYSHDDKTIHIFWRFYYKNTGLQNTLPLQELKYIFYHEVLHWFDHISGKPQAPADHNELFDKRMRALGWIK